MSVSSQITVVIPTSPIPSHPSTRIIEQAIDSVRAQLPDSPIEITCDVGTDSIVVASLACLWPNCTVYVPNDARRHQSGMLETALDYVTTPLLLFFEHDWELLPPVPWSDLSALILAGHYNTIKLHAQPRISPYHEFLMEERVVWQNGERYDRYQDNLVGDPIPLIHSRQWSQNPHLASTKFYRDVILPRCVGKCDFIENLLHGVVAHAPWSEWRTAIFNPVHGDMMRCRHLDGKGTL